MRRSTVSGPRPQRHRRVLDLRVEPLQCRPHGQHHVGHQHVSQRHHHAGLGEHEGQRRGDEPEREERLVHEARIAAEQQRPAQGARHHRDQERPQDHQQEDAAPRALHAIQDVGLGGSEHRRQQGDEEGDTEGAAEHLAVIGVGQHLAPILQDEDGLDALVLAPVVEREQHRHAERHDHDRREQQQRGEAEEIGGGFHAHAVVPTSEWNARRVLMDDGRSPPASSRGEAHEPASRLFSRRQTITPSPTPDAPSRPRPASSRRCSGGSR